jgi:PHD/YefM family antitoxin component YafN of YafNO toxin-antitoxin module
MIDEAARGRSLFIVTRMGKARAVVLGLEQYRDLLEDLEIKQEQSDPEFQAAMAEAKKDFELGRSLSLDELDKEFGFTEEELASRS